MKTKQHQIKEIIRCGKDPVYFMNKYLKIQHPMKGLIPFKTYPFQDDCVQHFNKHRFNIILKSRQLGISTLVAAYSVWQAIFYKEKNILIIATKLAVAQNFIRKVKTAIKSLPKWLMLPEIAANNKQQVEFSNGSQIKAVPTSEDAGRSEALSLLIIDEAAFVRNFDELWMGLYPTVSTGGRAIILSTPNGIGGQYHSLYSKADNKINEFNPIKLLWDVHPERDQDWFDRETKNMTARQIAQELLCDFASSGDTFFNSDFMTELRMQIKNPIERSGPENGVWYWSYPLEGNNYIVSADVSRGDSTDYSTFHVFNCNTMSIACEFQGKLPPDQFAILLYDIARRFNKASICPEANAYGYTVLVKLRDLGYDEVYFESEKDKNAYLFGNKQHIGKAGFHTKADTRKKVLAGFDSLIRNNTLKITSARLYEELKTFIYKNNKPQAMKGKNDDLVMSAAIGSWVANKNTGVYLQAASDMSIALLKGMGVNRSNIQDTNISPFYNDNNMHTLNPFMPVMMTDGIKNSLSGSSLIGKKMEFDWLL